MRSLFFALFPTGTPPAPEPSLKQRRHITTIIKKKKQFDILFFCIFVR